MINSKEIFKMETPKNILINPIFNVIFLNPSFKPFDVEYIKTKFTTIRSGHNYEFFLLPNGCNPEKHEFFCLHTIPPINFDTYRKDLDNTKYNNIILSGFSTEYKVLEAMFYYLRHHVRDNDCEIFFHDFLDCGIMDKWQAMQKRLTEKINNIH
jgi:hypothetical protein